MNEKLLDTVDYPQNLLDAIAGASGDKGIKWNTPLPEDINGTVEYVLYTLTKREMDVLHYRFQGGMTYSEVGNIYGVTRERIRQIEMKAIRKLRHPSRMRFLEVGALGKIAEAKNTATERAFEERLERAVTAVEKIADTFIDGVAIDKLNNELKNMQNRNDLTTKERLLERPLLYTDLSCRNINCLLRAGNKTIRDVTLYSREELSRLRNLGKHTADEIENYLLKLGLSLREDKTNEEI